MKENIGIPPHILAHFTDNEFWQVMPDAKANKTPSFYEFKPGMLKNPDVEDNDLFQIILQKFCEQSKVNKLLKKMPITL